MINQLVSYADPSGTSIANCNLQCMSVQRVWCANSSENYSSVPANAFVGHGTQAGDVVVIKCNDVTHAWVMAASGLADTVY